MRIAYLTAGAAGMYCGSCMHDNALARQLQKQGVECILQPIYTPIRTDEQDVSNGQVFFGGVNVYLSQKLPLLRFLPPGFRRWLDSPLLLRWATRGGGAASAKLLGQLTVSMLQGLDGRQGEEVKRLVRWLADDLQPTTVVLSNLLIGGAIPAIRVAMPNTAIVVTLQGDDIFLDYLPPPYRQQAIDQMRHLVASIDRVIVHSQFYAVKMAKLLQIPDEKLVVLPLAIDADPFLLEAPRGEPSSMALPGEQVHIGYLARLAPEKGLHHLIDAFIDVRSRESGKHARLHIAGWEGDQHRGYVANLKRKLSTAGATAHVQFHGSPDLNGKRDFLRQLDLLCVPTDYHDPKGLFVLEAWAAGIPVVQPDHGAFPEMIAASGGGWIVPPGNPQALAEQLHALLADAATRKRYGEAGRQYVLSKATIAHQATQLLEAIAAIETSPKQGARSPVQSLE